MTDTQGAQPSPSAFNARSDNAAQSLRAALVNDGAQMPVSAPVEVGPDGQPPAPPPPEGSYLAMAQAQQQLGDQPLAGTPDQAMDGSQAPPLAAAPPQAPPVETSPRAEQRIQELVGKLKIQQQELDQFKSLSQQAGDAQQQTQGQLEALQQQHQQMLQANLEHLDPETRMQVMQDARLSQMFENLEQRLTQRFQPQFAQLESRDQLREMKDLSNIYPAFDYQIHGPLVDMFRGKNPNCTIEQAYRAIAEPDELVTREAARNAAIPPVVAPGSSALANARYAPSPESQSDPEADLVAESQQIRDLRASSDPVKQKQGMDLVNAHLRKRLGG